MWGYMNTNKPFGLLCFIYDVGVLGCRDNLSVVVGLWGCGVVGIECVCHLILAG